MPFLPSAACRFFDLPPVNLQNLPLHLTKNSFASAPTHLCGIALTDFILPIGRRLLLRRESFCVPLQMLSLPATHGRGGSVSRRDQNQAYRRATVLTGGTKLEEMYAPNACRSSGGSAREGLLLEKPPPSHTPHVSHFPPLFGRERREGKDSHSRQWRLSMAAFLNRNKRPAAAPIEVAGLLAQKRPPPEFLTPRRSPSLRPLQLAGGAAIRLAP